MRIILIIIILFSSLGLAHSQGQSFQLKGYVNDYSSVVDNMIYLTYKQNGEEILDSAIIKKGKFAFKGSIQYPTIALLQLKVVDNVEKQYNKTRMLKDYAYIFYLDKGKIGITSDSTLHMAKVSGSAAETDQLALKNKIQPYIDAKNKIYKEEAKPAIEKQDTVALSEIAKRIYAMDGQIDSIKRAFLIANPKSGIALDLLLLFTKAKIEPSEILPIYDQLLPGLKGSPEGKELQERIEKSKLSASGVPAPGFQLKDRNGKSIQLADFKGKIVLLDFWGSWCIPCRQSHPHLKKIYDSYKDQGFEIVGIASEKGALENQFASWTKAMDDDQMDWTNVLDVEGNTGSVSPLESYQVTVFPTKVLIDREGRIIKKLTGISEETTKELDDLIQKNIQN